MSDYDKWYGDLLPTDPPMHTLMTPASFRAILKPLFDTQNEQLRAIIQEELQKHNEEQLSVANIMNEIAIHGMGKNNFEELVPQMLRAVCKDEHVDAVEEFIRQFDNIEWNWYPNG